MPIITSRNSIIKRFHWSMNQRLFSSATSQSVAIVKFENIYDSKCSNKKKLDYNLVQKKNNVAIGNRLPQTRSKTSSHLLNPEFYINNNRL